MQAVRRVVVPIVLAALLLAIYLPLRHAGFVNYDDGYYVAENPLVQRGLTWDGFVWAWTSWGGADNVHPLTWLSHMLDVSLFGLAAGRHHLVNVTFHLANALLLLALLQRLTGAFWRSALVAALWAVHPLRVESVAWISERKDVLSAFLGLLALGAYLRSLRRQGGHAYGASLVLYALSLLAKPMLVTFPALLLALDFWPLGRWPVPAGRRGSPGEVPAWLRAQLKEKLPFLLLAVAALGFTLLAHLGPRLARSPGEFGLAARVSAVVDSYTSYLWTTAWPHDLWIPYLLREMNPVVTGASLLLLVGISVVVLRGAVRRPHLAAGWCWYLAALVPVSGVIRLGEHVKGDRYTYLPLIGITLALVWALAPAARRAGGRALLSAAAVGAILALALLARRQAALWESDLRLMGHAVAADPANWVAHNNLGNSLSAAGDVRQAAEHYRAAVRINPAYARGYLNLGVASERLGQPREAAAAYREALRLNPALKEAHFNLGLMRVGAGDRAGAEEHLRALRDLDPALAERLSLFLRYAPPPRSGAPL